MGGRGSSSGISKIGHKYGSDYKTLLKYGNIKFVEKNSNNSEELLETMTKGRVYVEVKNNKLKSIKYFDKENKRTKSVDLDHIHEGMQPHTHHGYYHNENDSKKGATHVNDKERRLIERINKIWYNNNTSKS